MREVLPPALFDGPLGAYLLTIDQAKEMVIGESAAQVYRLLQRGVAVSYLKVCRGQPGSYWLMMRRLRWLGQYRRCPVC
ncbi:MAG: hypothetical protein R2867_16630 [Caldilineaceae bacterium]